MIVCLCKAVSDREIHDAMRDGHTSLQRLARHCGAGTGEGCGGCHEAIRDILETHGHSRPCARQRQEEEVCSSAEAEPLFGLASLVSTG